MIAYLHGSISMARLAAIIDGGAPSGPKLTKKMAGAMGLPWAPPPDLRAVDGDGYQAAAAFKWRRIFNPTATHDECPWPINTPEGRAWLAGWNRFCDDNYLKDDIRLTFQ